MAKYKITLKADADLLDIWLYTNETWGESQADKYLRGLENRFRYLADNPHFGRSRPELSGGLFSYHEGRHLIIYRHAGIGIEIVRILQDAMDLSQHV